MSVRRVVGPFCKQRTEKTEKVSVQIPIENYIENNSWMRVDKELLFSFST